MSQVTNYTVSGHTLGQDRDTGDLDELARTVMVLLLGMKRWFAHAAGLVCLHSVVGRSPNTAVSTPQLR
ncbi:hypothetical protein HaLaN_24755 [Haematococcus lacustris]|uniref:Uncharacterized protein n=1 Tax=Haematococcus lacustris TaxID=44745 RepID=A0A699ZVT0_HAELA|nr:hypothetical protein HaLaN_24755 [Haematococcus lacustris]